MPAISADTMVLPRIPSVDPTAADRPVLSVTTAPSGIEGEGFPVRRAFAGVDLRALDPFVYMVLPAPLGPRNPVIRPGRTSKVSSSTARTRPNRLVRPRTDTGVA
jgi:hypothetical protein